MPTPDEWDDFLEARYDRVLNAWVTNALVTVMPDDDDDELLGREAAHAQSFLSALDEQFKSVLDTLNIPTGEVGVGAQDYDPPAIASDPLKLAETLPSDTMRAAGQGLSAELAARGAQVTSTALLESGVGINWRLVNSQALSWAESYSYELVGGINRNTAEQIAGILSRWISEGRPKRDLVEEIGTLFNSVRANLIATTEATRAYAVGSYLSYVEAGDLVEELEWFTAMDDRVCPVCGPLEGATSLMVRGSNGVGSFGTLGVSCPAHPGCRCRIGARVRKAKIYARLVARWAARRQHV